MLGGARVITLSYEIAGAKSLKPFGDAAAAMNFAVRLVQSGAEGVGQFCVRNDDGDTIFTHDDIAKVSRVVRLA